ncbi:MAG: hypothetical protein CR975_06110 [Gammaproteobacteria bacterium]|nr:MAG: hypothetical protein CR975_06110 [Gammaproteobacteria bacterium]
MKERITTALVMIAIVIGVIFFVPILFAPLVAVVLGVSIWEWCRIAQLRQSNSYLVAGATIILWVLATNFPLVLSLLLVLSIAHYVYAVHLIRQYEKIDNYRIHRGYLRVSGPVILSAMAATLIYIFDYSLDVPGGEDPLTLLFVILVIAVADSAAYFAGRFFGKHKLAPRVSPNKTIEGLIGGFLGVIVFVCLAQSMVEGWYLPLPKLLLIALVAAAASVIGDLFVSIVKRQNHIKDTSQILPGHGGVLDRIDGQLAGIPVFYLLQQFS